MEPVQARGHARAPGPGAGADGFVKEDRLTVSAGAFRPGDVLRVEGALNQEGNGKYVVTGVDYGLGGSSMVVSKIRFCPECETSYFGLHPDAPCAHGAVERIMES